ncbi:MAG: ribonuclease H-like domain-containing protein [Thermoplasmata archaeon]
MERVYQTEQFKWKLLNDNKGKDVQDVLGGFEDENKYGFFHRINTRYEKNLNLPSRTRAAEAILGDFKIIPGVGPVTASKFAERGIRDILDLTKDSRWCSKAEPICGIIEEGDLVKLQALVERCHSLNHPNCYFLTGYARIEDLLFFDIETMGLSSKPLFLIGIGRFDEGAFVVDQFFARDTSEEKAVIQEFLNYLSESSVLVSFNGRSFDSRYIEERMVLHGLKGFNKLPHFDLLRMCRGKWSVPNYRLTTLERFILGEEREEDVPSSLVPHFYEIYMRKNNPGPVIPVIDHNKQDIVSMVSLLNHMARDELDK